MAPWLGADGHDFEPVAAELGRSGLDHVRYVFPHAPVRPVTINGGMAMRAWYDIAGPELDRRADEEGVRASAEIAGALVDEQVSRGIAGERIVLAGFSQGGAIALYAGLRLPFRIAGILALSTYLPAPGSLESEAHPVNRGRADLPRARKPGPGNRARALGAIRGGDDGPRVCRRDPHLSDASFGVPGGGPGHCQLAATGARTPMRRARPRPARRG